MKFLMDRISRRPDRNWNLQLTQNIVFLVCFITLLAIYTRIIFITPTVYELGDEYEYLWNAAFFTGRNWPDIYLEYYGYGYSVFLIPAIVFCKSGTGIIRAAYILNVLFIISIYCVFNGILCVISNSKKKIYYPIISFIACLSPYFFSNVAKVFCEICLSFFYSLDVLFIVLVLKRRRGIYYFCTGVVTAYLYAIHTRSIGIIVIYLGLLYIDYILNRKELQKTILSIGIMMISILILFGIKSYILDYKVSLMEETTHFNNVIDGTFVFNRIMWLMSGISNYIGAFFAKIFYWFFATYGLVFLLIEYLKGDKEKKNRVEEREVIFFALSVGVVSIILCNLNGTGGNAYYIIYGRYYEFSAPLLVCMGLYILFERQVIINIKKLIFQILCMTAICKGVMSWMYSFMADYMVEIDTNRLSYFSMLIKQTPDVLEVLFVALVIVIVLLFGYMEVLKKKLPQIVCMMALAVLSLLGGKNCIDSVSIIHERTQKDLSVANYLLNNCVNDIKKIYFLDDKSYVYDNFYSRILLLIKPLDLDVIEIDTNKENTELLSELEEKDYLITYLGSNIAMEEMNEYYKIMDGTSVTLYQKQ